jgi:hypothetical protein
MPVKVMVRPVALRVKKYLDRTKAVRDMMPTQQQREALQLIWKMADVIFSPLGK